MICISLLVVSSTNFLSVSQHASTECVGCKPCFKRPLQGQAR
jgi:hypothetical protein